MTTNLRIGIDVGGTNTDAVLMDGPTVRAKLKTPTTEDVTGGIATAIGHILGESAATPADIAAVMIGTTHFTNAIVERQHLEQTGVLRLCLPAGLDIPPMTDWPTDIRDALGHHVWMVAGGNEFDGREISPLDIEAIHRVADAMLDRNIAAIAISAPFALVTPEMERRAAAILRERIPQARITLSHEIGQLGLLERENAAILNACLRPLAQRTIAAFRKAVAHRGIVAPLYLTQNDGTLMDAAFAAQFPVLTIASGPSNSVRGAAFLSGLRNALVLDVGGTTCDLGVLVDGFPRKASVAVQVGGVRTNFRMPDVHSFGLGGGTIVTRHDDDGVSIGPLSVGYRLTTEARVFGGDTITATDIAVASGWATLGNPALVGRLGAAFIETAVTIMRDMVDAGVDRMKTSAEPVSLIVVGGGSILIREVNGVSELVKPPHYDVANAVGAAIAQISGEIDRIFALDGPDHLTRDQALGIARAEAAERAIAAGADPPTIEIVDLEDVPLAYLPGNATRIRAKAVGNLRFA